MAELMGNKGQIVAWDLHEHRVKLVQDTAKRLGIDMIKTEVRDATIYEEKYQNRFDKILLDVPCLGFGVLKRKPDIKWKRKKEDIEQIQKIQLKILNTCSEYLKKGGEIVYSTCSILMEENEQVVERALKKVKAQIEPVSRDGYQGIPMLPVKLEGTMCVCPDRWYEGFFVAKLKKK